jgi:outer membrane protein OmpA-like peptidoglycan-associated protein
MPLTDFDVLQALGDSKLQRLDYWVDNIHIRGEAYMRLFDLVDRQQILVVSGDNPARAEYDAKTDTITTQKAESPANLTNRAVLLHESTHALVDMERITTTWHANEACAYITEGMYLLLSTNDPQPFNKAFISGSVIPWIRAKRLDSAPGGGLRFSFDDIIPLIVELNKHPAYHQDNASITLADGISPKPVKFLKTKDTFDPSPSVNEAQLAYKPPELIFFADQRYDLNAEAVQALQKNAPFIKQVKGPGDRVYITGHADSTGDSAHNQPLSKLRADAVERWLIAHAVIKPGDAVTLGKGSTMPIASNGDADGRAQNRRVDILIM